MEETDDTSSSQSSVSFLNRSFSSDKSKRQSPNDKETPRSKANWNFDDLSASLLSTSDLLERINNRKQDDVAEEGNDVNIDKKTELIAKVTDAMPKNGAQRVINEDDTMDIPVHSSRSSLDKSTSSSSSSLSQTSPYEENTYNDTHNSFQFPLKLWKKGDGDDISSKALGPPMRKTGDVKQPEELSKELSKESAGTSSGCNSNGSLFSSESSNEGSLKRNTSYVSTESELSYNESSNDSLKLSSTLEESFNKPPKSPSKSTFENMSPERVNKRPPRSPSITLSPSIIDSPSRNTRSKKSRVGPSPRSPPRRSPRKPSKASSPRRSPRKPSPASSPIHSPRRNSARKTNDDSPARNTRQHKRLSSPLLSSSSKNNSSVSSALSSLDSSSSLFSSIESTKEMRRETADSDMLSDLLDLQQESNEENEASKLSRDGREDTQTIKNLMIELQDTTYTEKIRDKDVSADFSDLRSLSLLADQKRNTPSPKQISKRVPTPFSKASSNDSINGSTEDTTEQNKVLKSILNSNRKPMSKKPSILNRKKTIAFGSPEVAEFNSNSPSGNFTPLPAREARLLGFKIPSPHNSSVESEDNCFESTTSPIHKVDDTTTIEVDVNSLLSNTKYYDNPNVNASDTVELESNVEDIMKKNLDQSESSSMDLDQTNNSQMTKSYPNTTAMSPIAESREMDSSESMLLSPYSPCSPSILKEDRNSIASLNNPFDESMLDDNFIMGKSLNFEQHASSEFNQSNESDDEFPPIGSSIVSHENDVVNFLSTVANKSVDTSMIQTMAKGDKMKCTWAVPTNENMSFGFDDSCITNQNIQTCELEGNIEELVNLNEDRVLKRAADSTPSLTHGQMRRLTLTSPSKNQIDVRTDETTNKSYLSIKKKETNSHSKPKSNPFNELDMFHQHPALNISYEDILVEAGLDKPINATRDVLINAYEASCQSRIAPIVETANTFLSAACKEVQQQADTVNDFDKIFKDNIKKIISSSQDKRGYDLETHLKHQLVQLIKRVHAEVSSECMQWEMQVTAALNDAILRISNEVESEERTAKMKMNLIDDAFESIEISEEKLIRRARRKSINRRKNAVTEMEERIKKLELRVKEKEAELELSKKEYELVTKLENELDNYFMLVSATEKSYKNADRARWRFRTVERMQSWVFKNTHPNSNRQLELHFQGQMKETCTILTIPLISPHEVSCKVDPSIYLTSFRKCPLSKYTASLKNYINTSVSSIRNQIDKTRICLSNGQSLKREVQKKVNYWETSLCRIELGAQELGTILNRYNASLQRHDNKFSIVIDFNKLKAQFWINEYYPFCFMEMQVESLEEGINIDHLVRLLNARVKPGYRYLSRICELTESFLIS